VHSSTKKTSLTQRRVQLPRDSKIKTPPANDNMVICHCGRRCRGLRGLVAHQRSCRATDILTGVDPTIDRIAYNAELINNNSAADINTINSSEDLNFPCLSPITGLSLPKSKEEWQLANLFFQCNPPIGDNFADDLDSSAERLQTSIYSYFKKANGTHTPRTQQADDSLPTNSSIRAMRRRLRSLKNQQPPPAVEVIQASTH